MEALLEELEHYKKLSSTYKTELKELEQKSEGLSGIRLKIHINKIESHKKIMIEGIEELISNVEDDIYRMRNGLERLTKQRPYERK